jgi:hypothetical protein
LSNTWPLLTENQINTQNKGTIQSHLNFSFICNFIKLF